MFIPSFTVLGLSNVNMGGCLWSWLYGSWIYNYLCNRCIRIPLWQGVLETLCGKVGTPIKVRDW